MTSTSRNVEGGGPDGGAGGVAAAATDKLEPFGAALAELLEKRHRLTYVRRDGYTLLSELLGTQDARGAIEALAPGCWRKNEASDDAWIIHPVVLDAVRRVVATYLTPDGHLYFDHWDDDSGGWLRSIGRPPQRCGSNIDQAADQKRGDSETLGAIPERDMGRKNRGGGEDVVQSARASSTGPEHQVREDDQVAKLGSCPSPQLRQSLDGAVADRAEEEVGVDTRQTAARAGAAPEQPVAAGRAGADSTAAATATGDAERKAPQASGGRSSTLPAWVLRRQASAAGPAQAEGQSGGQRSSPAEQAAHPERPVPPAGQDDLLALPAGPWAGCALPPERKAPRPAAAARAPTGRGTAPRGEGPPHAPGQPCQTELWLSGGAGAPPLPGLGAGGAGTGRGAAPTAREGTSVRRPPDGRRRLEAAGGSGRPLEEAGAAPPSLPACRRYLGSLKSFNAERCFGFISSREFDSDVFVHARSLRDPDPERFIDAEVEFSLDGRSSPDRPRAMNVRVLGEASKGPGAPRAPGGSRPPRERLKGRLRAFWSDRSFGFIACHDGSTDVFVHANSFEGGRLPDDCVGTPDSSPTGQEVEFFLDMRRPERPRATSVRIVGEALRSPSGRPADGDPGEHRGREGGAPPREARTRQLVRALLRVLQRRDGLEYVRKDGFALLPEVLATEEVRSALEAIVPAGAADLLDGSKPDIPAAVLTVLRGVVKTTISERNIPCFELWEGDADGGWIRLQDSRPALVLSAPAPGREPGHGREHGHGVAAERHRDSLRASEPRGGAASQQQREKENPRESAQATAAEAKGGAASEGGAWWQGDTGPSRQSHNTPSGVHMLDDWGTGQQAGAAKGKSVRTPEASDPWANSADPWSWGMQAQGDAGGREAVAAAAGADAAGEGPEGGAAPPLAHEGAEGEEGSERELAAEDACKEPQPLEAESAISGQEAIREVLRLLPADAPRGVREYLASMAQLVSS